MDGISDIRIVAIDTKRPPVLRKEPYIDLFFALSHKAPKNWCEQFNALVAKQKFSASIQAEDGLYIETWVRTIDDVAENFAFLKQKVSECTEQYIAKVLASQGKQDAENSATSKQSGEQGRLNAIVAGLVFDD